jgi:elongation factor Ts
MAISAKDVARLRAMTSAGMMDCKKALTEADGDFDQAVELLRKRGQAKASKRADREAKEGAIFVHVNEDNTKAVLIELNCETDFVARNDSFQEMGTNYVNFAAAQKPADLDALKALKMNGRVISDLLTEATGSVGEKIDISKYEVVSGEKVVAYIHPGARIGVAVAFSGANGGDVESVGKDVAMQITAMNPAALDKDAVDQETIDRELRIGREQAIAEGKPEKILDKIAEGKLNKFFKDHTLLNQEFVKDTSKTVGNYIKESLGKEAQVIEFKRLQLGVN